MKIGIASDHRGYKLKQEIIKNLKNYDFVDYGTTSEESVDYPDYGIELAENVAKKNVDYGVAICGSGIGISIACNKVKKIRCAKVSSIEEAKITRIDNDSNIIAFSSDLPLTDALQYVTTFVETNFSNLERHKKRIDKITQYEEKNEC